MINILVKGNCKCCLQHFYSSRRTAELPYSTTLFTTPNSKIMIIISPIAHFVASDWLSMTSHAICRFNDLNCIPFHTRTSSSCHERLNVLEAEFATFGVWKYLCFPFVLFLFSGIRSYFARGRSHTDNSWNDKVTWFKKYGVWRRWRTREVSSIYSFKLWNAVLANRME